MPLEIRDTHFLARAVVHTAKHINAVVVVLCAVKEARKRHRCQLHKLQGLQVQDHGILCTCAVVVAAQDDNLVRGYQHGGFCFNRERELDEQDCPAVICHVILFDRVNPPIALISTEHVDVAVFEDDCRHCASLLVEFGDALPAIQVDRVAFAALQDPIDRATANRIHVVALMGQSMRVPTLQQAGLLMGGLVNRVVHEDLSGHICEGRVQTACDEYAAVVKANGHRVALQNQIFRDKLLCPAVLRKVVLQNHLGVV